MSTNSRSLALQSIVKHIFCMLMLTAETVASETRCPPRRPCDSFLVPHIVPPLYSHFTHYAH